MATVLLTLRYYVIQSLSLVFQDSFQPLISKMISCNVLWFVPGSGAAGDILPHGGGAAGG